MEPNRENKEQTEGFNNDDLFPFEEKYRNEPPKRPSGGGATTTVPKLSGKQKALIAILLVICMVCAFGLGLFSYQFVNSDVGLFIRLKNMVERYYYEDPSSEDLILAAGKGMLQSLDAYSTMLSPREVYDLLYPEIREEPSYGVRFYREYDGGPIKVYAVAIGSSGYEAGLMRGDKVLAVNGTVLKDGVSNADFLALVGKNGATLKVSRLDNEVTTEFEAVLQPTTYTPTFVDYYFKADNGVVRSNMSQKYVESKGVASLNDGIGYLRLTEFSTAGTHAEITAAKDFERAMLEFRAVYGGKGKLVLDLRDNPGGQNDIAAAIASFLLYDGNQTHLKVTTLRGKGDAVIETTYTDSVYADYFDVSATTPQIVCLTNGNSASASELILGAMLDYGTCVQVGSGSYGKGIAQGILPVSDNVTIEVNGEKVTSYYAAYLTIARFYTPLSDECHHGKPYLPSAENQTKSMKGAVLRANEIW